VFLSGALVTAPAHEWLLARPVKDVSGSGSRVVSAALVEDLDDMTGKLRRMDDQMGGGSLIDMVSAQASYVARLLREGSYTDLVGRRLHRTLGELLRLAGWVSYDSGDEVRAQRFWVAALHAAHTAGDTAMGANILGFMSDPAWNLGRSSDAVKLAETALCGVSGSGPRVRAILHMRAALAYAANGDSSDCRRAIDQAYSSLRTPSHESDEPDWCYWMDEAMHHEQIGTCLMLISDHQEACEHLSVSLRAESGQAVREGVLRLTRLATAHARQGEPELACQVATRAVDGLCGPVDSGRLVHMLQGVGKELRFYQNVPAVQEFTDRAGALLG
jgi:hypothetical protein